MNDQQKNQKSYLSHIFLTKITKKLDYLRAIIYN